MKNSLKFLLIVFFSFYAFNFSLSDELKFEASKIELLENQNVIKASGEIKIFLENETEINAEKFIYNKKKSIGTVEDNVKIDDRLNKLQTTSTKASEKKQPSKKTEKPEAKKAEPKKNEKIKPKEGKWN